MKNTIFLISLFSLTFCKLSFAGGEVVWQKNGIPIGDGNYIHCVAIVEDGSGGAILAIQNKLKEGSIYAQRIDSDGNILWPGNGALLRDTSEFSTDFNAVSDEKGGMILVWKDDCPHPYIRAQRVDSGGNILWGEDGIVITRETSPDSRPPNADYYVKSISDGYGGAIIAWTKIPNSFTEIYPPELYAQRVDSSGKLLWGAGGIRICPEAKLLYNWPAIAGDGDGGVIITWTDSRNVNNDIYAQHVDSKGNLAWDNNGLPICLENNDQYMGLISKVLNGWIILWGDNQNGNWDIFSQKIDKNGNILWPSSGLIVCDAPSTQYESNIVEINDDDIIISWFDERSIRNRDIYSQKISSLGETKWEKNGVYVGTVSDTTQEATRISLSSISDRHNGIISTWTRYESGNWEIYAQHIDSSGVLHWGENGLPICTDSHIQCDPLIVSDGHDGAIIVWHDLRGWRAGTCVYAQRVRDSAEGIEGGSNSRNPKTIKLLQNYPNPFNPATVINYQISEKKSISTTLKIYNIMGEEIRTLVDQEQGMGSYTVEWDGRDSRGFMVANGIYFYQLKTEGYFITKKLVVLR